MSGFSAAAFRALLDRADLEWSTAELAARSGVSRRTINTWMSGPKRPYLPLWERVARVLAMERCGHCQGTGAIDPTDERVAELTDAVRSKPQPILRKPRLLVKPIPLNAASFGNLELEPNTRSLALSGGQVVLTRQEYRLLATIIEAQGRYVTPEELAEAIWRPELSQEANPGAARTYLARLRAKCEQAGLAWPVVTGGSGLGYRIEVPA